MKKLSALLVAAALAWASQAVALPPAPSAVKGVVLETMNSGGYTYIRLKTQGADTWAAVNRAAVKKGDHVSIENALVMNDFESRSLNRTFPTILFGTLGGVGAAPAATLASPAQAPDGVDTQVAKASGANARTVAEIVSQGAALKDKPVLLHAKVVKYNAGILGKNWLHVRDGTGSAATRSNDILVTTAAEAKLGEIVTVQGTVRTDKDFGAGYVYEVLVEDAKLSR